MITNDHQSILVDRESIGVSGPSGSITCIGIDLAWSPRNLSGLATLRGDQQKADLIDVRLVLTDQEIVEYVSEQAGSGTVIIAVDAPLWVPNQTGRRPAEAEIAQVFRRFQAGAHPANRGLLTYDGVIRGEVLVTALADLGIEHQAQIEAGIAVRQVIEVFPHAAMVGIFGLDRILRYKAKPKRTREERLQEWRRYQDLLLGLRHGDPILRGIEEICGEDVSRLRGRRLKDYEDRIDALMCAYTALYGFRWGMSRCRTFGSREAGYIFSPVPKSGI